MKRDMDLIRLLLLNIEGEEKVDLKEYTNEQINYHKALLIEANLAQGKPHFRSGVRPQGSEIIPDMVVIQRLTWDGHEFLNNTRNKTVWDKAKSIIAEKGLSITIDVLKMVIPLLIKNMIQ